MKGLIRLLIIGLIGFGAWNYIEHNHIDLKEVSRQLIPVIGEKIAPRVEKNEELASIPQSAPNPAPTRSSTPSPTLVPSGETTVPGGKSIQSTRKLTFPEAPAEKELSMKKAKVEFPDVSGDLSLDVESEVATGTVAGIDWVKEVTERYSPGSWALLMLYDGLPGRSEAPNKGGGIVSSQKPVSTFHYLEGESAVELLSSMETNVHEIAHGYFHQNTYAYANAHGIELDFDCAEGFLYLSPGESWFISHPQSSLFPSKDLASVIPSRLRTFRYDPYIDGHTSTQGEGIIGLLNEFHAYYLGSRFNYDMLKAYQEAEGNRARGLFSWVQHTQSSMTAYYEFDYFIRTYLQYLKENKRDDYNMLMDNSAFVQSYRHTQTLYAGLIDKYLLRIDREIHEINSIRPGTAKIEAHVLWVATGEKNRRSGTPIFSKDSELLIPELQKNSLDLGQVLASNYPD